MKYLLLFAACLAFYPTLSPATSTSMYHNVEESKISYSTYQAAFEHIGPSKELPKLLVFSSTGECVGVSDDKTPTPDKVIDFITESLHNNHKACNAVTSSKFGVSKLGKGSGTGKPEIELLVIDNFPFCTACNEFKQTLLRESHSSLADMHLTIMAVSLDKHP